MTKISWEVTNSQGKFVMNARNFSLIPGLEKSDVVRVHGHTIWRMQYPEGVLEQRACGTKVFTKPPMYDPHT